MIFYGTTNVLVGIVIKKNYTVFDNNNNFNCSQSSLNIYINSCIALSMKNKLLLNK